MASDENTMTDAEAMQLAVGTFICNFNMLDDRLNYVLAVLLNPNNTMVGEFVGAALMFSKKRQLIRALVRQMWGAEAAEQFEALNAQIKDMNRVRTVLAHGEQWVDAEGAFRQRSVRVTDKGLSWKHTEYSPEEIFSLAGQVATLGIDLWNSICEHFDHKASSEASE